MTLRLVAAPTPEFEREWRKHYASTMPTGWIVRYEGVGHWVRFHSLPESERYATTDDERGIVLARANVLAQHTLGEGTSCWLVQACWRPLDEERVEPYDPFWPCREHQLAYQFSVREPGSEDDDEATDWRIHAGLVDWRAGAFDRIVRSCAADRLAPVLWMSRVTGAVFAPYDGGVDLFLASEAEVTVLRRRFASWLSDHPDGL